MIAYVGVVASGGLTVSLKAQVKYQSVTSNARISKKLSQKRLNTEETKCICVEITGNNKNIIDVLLHMDHIHCPYGKILTKKKTIGCSDLPRDYFAM